MDITNQNMSGLFSSFNTVFNKGFKEAKTYWPSVAMKVPSQTAEENYGWLGDLPGMREWVGDRVIHDLSGETYRIRNRDFEETVSVKRNDIDDDRYGIYAPLMEKLGADAAKKPDMLIFDLMASGFTTPCYDGQYFFDTDHPVGAGLIPPHSVSNVQAGSGPAWFLLDGSQVMKPMIYQEREKVRFIRMDQDTDEAVFMKNMFLYGAHMRMNVGFGLWQLAYASKAELTRANYSAARKAMQKFHNDAGAPLGIKPTHLVVPPDLEEAALTIANAELVNAGESNIWAGTVEVIVSPYLERYQPIAA